MWKGARGTRASLLSIPFRMLRATRNLLNVSGDDVLSIPFRMLLGQP